MVFSAKVKKRVFVLCENEVEWKGIYREGGG